jgi:hypothetical protein
MQMTLSWRKMLAMTVFALAIPTAARAETRTLALTTGGRAVVHQAAGPNAGSIQSTVDAFRNALGTLNPNTPGSAGSGRREINWDGVPDAFADPNLFPPDFFNTTSPRGVVYFPSGRDLLVSANAVNPTSTPIEFGRINATYPTQFKPFSPQRLFTTLADRNVTVVKFFIPGSTTPAVSTGFGSIFTDVDLNRSTEIEFFNKAGKSLLRQFVPRSPGAGSLSFLGVVFAEPVLARVRIKSGSVGLGRNDAPGRGRDIVVMDDFIFGEPVAP